MDKIFDLAKKIKALADKGVGGEKDNAARMLQDLCSKHGIDPANLEDEVKRARIFDYKPETYEIVLQCIASSTSEIVAGWKDGRRKAQLFTKLTDAEYIEVEAKIEFYVPLWLKELSTFRSAFIQVQGIAVKSDNEDGETMDPKELAELVRKMRSMTKQTPTKRIGPGNEDE